MNVVFIGTSAFAVPALERLAGSGHEVPLVVTQPDRPAGRGLKVGTSAVKRFCEDRGLPLFQPDDVSSPDSLDRLRAAAPDVAVVASYGAILRKRLLELPTQGCINIHASLLPKYRGAAPVAYAIMNGETMTGVTIFRIVRKLDAGPVLGMRETSIQPEETCGMLEERLAHLGAELLLEVLEQVEKGMADALPQDESLASYAPKITGEDRRIDWNDRAETIANKIRAFRPKPGASTHFSHGRKEMRIIPLESQALDEKHTSDPGTVLRAAMEGIDVACGEQSVMRIIRLQPESKRPLTAAEFINGYRVDTTARFF